MTNINQSGWLTYTKLISKFAATLLTAVLFFTSCTVTKNSYYFKKVPKDTTINVAGINEDELKIKANDMLYINISSLSKEEDFLFETKSDNKDVITGYEVNKEGNIYLHKIGKLRVEGMTRKEVKIRLEKELQPYLKDPVVVVSFMNHHVTVIGEIGSPKLIDMPTEKISLMDAIAAGGGIKESGSIKNVLIIRESPTTKQFKHINLEDQSVFTSPWYYLQPNDVIVISPDEEKAYKEQKRQKNQQVLAMILSGISVAVIILDRIFR